MGKRRSSRTAADCQQHLHAGDDRPRSVGRLVTMPRRGGIIGALPGLLDRHRSPRFSIGIVPFSGRVGAFVPPAATSPPGGPEGPGPPSRWRWFRRWPATDSDRGTGSAPAARARASRWPARRPAAPAASGARPEWPLWPRARPRCRTSHSPGSIQLDSPMGSRTDTGGVNVPVSSWTVPIRPPKATRLSISTKVLRKGARRLMVAARGCCNGVKRHLNHLLDSLQQRSRGPGMAVGPECT